MHEGKIILQKQRPRFIDSKDEPLKKAGRGSSVRQRSRSSHARMRGRSAQVSFSRPSFSANSSRREPMGDSRSENDFSETKRNVHEVGLVGAFSQSRDKKRKEKNKLKAEKMFEKQFGEDANKRKDSSSASFNNKDYAGGVPRPALYKGQMGSKHRKSSKMQQQVKGYEATSFFDRFAFLRGVADHPAFPRVTKLATVGICICVVAFCLYTPAQHFYHAQRENDRLVAEYTVIKERNNALDIQNDILASKAGMEDAVRKKLGYVKDGENAAVVTGLSASATNKNKDNENVEATVLSRSVQAPEAWYTPFLDTFFHFE